MKKLTHKQLLQIIEGLCILFEDGDTDSIERAKMILGEIYQIAHLHGDCGNEHLDWHEFGIQIAKDLTENEITKVEGID